MAFLQLILVVIGALECFAGYKIYKIWLAVSGFMVGAVIGGLIGQIGGDDGLAIVLALFLGALCAALNVFFMKLGVFIQCFCGGFLFAFVPLGMSQIPADAMSMGKMAANLALKGETGIDLMTPFVLALILGILCGILGVIFFKFAIILSSSVLGGFLISMGIGLMTDISLVMGFTITLTILGVSVQYLTTGKKKEQTVSAASQTVQTFDSATAVPPEQTMEGKTSEQTFEQWKAGGEKVIQTIQQTTEDGVQKLKDYQEKEAEKAKEKSGTLLIGELLDQVEAFLYQNKMLAWCMPFTKGLAAGVLLLYIISGIISVSQTGFWYLGALDGVRNAAPLLLVICLLCEIKKEHITTMCILGSEAVGTLLYWLILAQYGSRWMPGVLSQLVLYVGFMVLQYKFFFGKKEKVNQENGAGENGNVVSINPEKNGGFCPQCGAKLKPGVKFCFKCGRQIESVK